MSGAVVLPLGQQRVTGRRGKECPCPWPAWCPSSPRTPRWPRLCSWLPVAPEASSRSRRRPPQPSWPRWLAACAGAPGRCLRSPQPPERPTTSWPRSARLLDPETVTDFPSWETLPHERLSPRSDTVGRRLAVLRRLVHPDPADPGAGPLARSWSPPCVRCCSRFVTGLGDLEPVRSTSVTRSTSPRSSSGSRDSGYSRADVVERRGEFAVRGGILDVFPAVEQHPLRVELWGDTVEEIRWFKAADQRSLEAAPHGVWAPPVRELPLTETVRRRAGDARERAHPGLADVLGQLAEGVAVEGMESLSPLLGDGMELLVDVVPDATRRGGGRPRAGAEPAATSCIAPARSSSRLPGRTPRPGTARRSTWGRLPTVSWRRCGRPRSAAALPWWGVGPFGGPDDETAGTSAARRGRVPGRHRPGAEDHPRVRRRWVARRARHGGARSGRAVRRAAARRRCRRRGGCRGRPGARRLRRAGGHRRHGARPGLATASSCSCSPRPTWSGRSRRRGTCDECRRGGAPRWTRCSCPQVTTSCTSSTASGATSR